MASARLENGVSFQPVATLSDGDGIAHIWVDDGCYVLGVVRGDLCRPVSHWFPAAVHLLRSLPQLPGEPPEIT